MTMSGAFNVHFCVLATVLVALILAGAFQPHGSVRAARLREVMEMDEDFSRKDISSGESAIQDSRRDDGDNEEDGDNDNKEDSDTDNLPRAICRNRKRNISSLTNLLRAIADINEQEGFCKRRYMPAINEFDPILKFKRDQLCSDEAFKLIRDYHFRFIQPMRQSNRAPTQFEPMPRDIVKAQLFAEPRKYTVDFDEHNQILVAPIAIRHAFLKFALQVSFTCKLNLVDNLVVDSQRILNDQDQAIMQLFDKETPIGQSLASAMEKIDFDSVLYMPDLDGELTGVAGARLEARKKMGDDSPADDATTSGDGQQVHHLKTTANENSSLFQMVYACKNRFKPIYDQLIIPIVRLSKLGYDYQGPELNERQREFLTGPQMKQWLVLVHVCEIFKNTHVIRAEGPALPPSRQLSQQQQQQQQQQQSELEKANQLEETNEGTLVEVSDEKEIAQLERTAEELRYDYMAAVDYEPGILNELADGTMINGERELNAELARKQGNKNPFGLRGVLRRSAKFFKRTLAKLDMERFAHYRRHSLWYSGVLNFISSCSNVASITITIVSTAGAPVG